LPPLPDLRFSPPNKEGGRGRGRKSAEIEGEKGRRGKEKGKEGERVLNPSKALFWVSRVAKKNGWWGRRRGRGEGEGEGKKSPPLCARTRALKRGGGKKGRAVKERRKKGGRKEGKKKKKEKGKKGGGPRVQCMPRRHQRGEK